MPLSSASLLVAQSVSFYKKALQEYWASTSLVFALNIPFSNLTPHILVPYSLAVYFTKMYIIAACVTCQSRHAYMHYIA